MTRYLLDTHAAMWFFNGDNSLSETADKIIRDISNPEGMTLITADENITHYKVPQTW